MAVCARCGTKISFRAAHFGGDHVCDECRQTIAAEHATAEASYQYVLDLLTRPLGDVVTNLQDLRVRKRPDALTSSERLAMDVAAFTKFAHSLIGGDPLSDWADTVIRVVADALGALSSDGWREEYEAIGDELLLAVVRAGRAQIRPIPGDFVPNANEGMYLQVSATHVWVIVEKELKLDETGLEVSRDGKVALSKGKISGHEVEHRRTVSEPGTLFVTNQRLVYVSGNPLSWAPYGAIGRIRTADKGEILFDVNGRDQPWRFRFAKPDIVRAYIDYAAAVSRGAWRQPTFTPAPETPPADADTERMLERAARGAIDSGLVRLARLYQHLGTLNHDWLEQTAALVPELPATTDDAATDTGVLGDAPTTPTGGEVVPPTDPQLDQPFCDAGPPADVPAAVSHEAAAAPSDGPVDLADLSVEIGAVESGLFPDRNGRPIAAHGVLVAVALRVRNTTKEVQDISSRMFELIEQDGTCYSSNAGAGESQIMLLGSNVSLIGRRLQPSCQSRA